MQDDYIESRLNPQIEYYDKKSVHCHKEHDALSIIGIVLTASIPPLTLLSEVAPVIKFAVAIAGAVASILSSVLYLHNSKENWVEFRTICESLKSEKEKYIHSVSDYGPDRSEQTRDSLFIETCEAMMQKERASWRSRTRDSHSQEYTNHSTPSPNASDSSSTSS